MKTHQKLFLSVAILLTLFACSKDEDATPANTIQHEGEKWNIVSVQYTLIDQNLTAGNQIVNNGTATNAGAFYFNNGKGSFDITINSTHKEDYYGYSESGTEVTITNITQSVNGSAVSQNSIAITGDKTNTTTMVLTGAITKQTTTSQFSLAGTFTLQKN